LRAETEGKRQRKICRREETEGRNKGEGTEKKRQRERHTSRDGQVTFKK
jgi:hypothetical protein